MKSYPSIPSSGKVAFGQPCHVFYKYDGSNLRWEWNKKREFHKFGTRTRLFDSSDLQFGDAVELFMDHYAGEIQRAVLDLYKVDQFIAFTEYFGANSFAGSHVEGEPKELVLFDINLHKKGFISPTQFVECTKSLDFTAKYFGKYILDESLVSQIRTNTFDSLLNEGVIVKGGEGHHLWMAKIKTEEYLQKLKSQYKDNWKQFWE